jgi:uncharacterized protein HemY
VKTVKYILLSLLVCGAVSAKIVVTLQSGVERTIDSLTIKDGRLLLPPENVQILLAQVASVEFGFDGFSIEQCRALFDQGDYAGIVRRLANEKPSLLAAASLKGNAPDWLRLFLRAQFHSGNVAAMRSTTQALQTAGSSLAAEMVPYEILALIEENRITEAAKAFDASKPADNAASDLIRARLSVAGGNDKEALQHLARLQGFHYREKEWLLPAVFLEGQIYKKAGQTRAAAYAAEELNRGWPGSVWSRRAAELKESETKQGESP